MMKLTAVLFFTILLSATANAQPKKKFTIAFGSCNRQNLPQTFWPTIAENKPDVWIWLGDNIYGDSDDMAVLKSKYDLQKEAPAYKKFVSERKIIGVWDDHDFGRNDAGKQYPYKKESQQLALDFLDEPQNSIRRKQEGIYASYEYALNNKTIKVILLDGRYNRDTLMKENKVYIPNTNGDILGAEQWSWLAKELKNSKADVHIIGCGVQVLSAEHPYEKWENFPESKKRLLKLFEDTKPKGLMMISGDRHIGEFSKIEIDGIETPVFDITSSGLTHSATNNTNEKNALRKGPLVNQRHFGIIDIEDQKKSVKVNISLKSMDNQIYHQEFFEVK